MGNILPVYRRDDEDRKWVEKSGSRSSSYTVRPSRAQFRILWELKNLLIQKLKTPKYTVSEKKLNLFKFQAVLCCSSYRHSVNSCLVLFLSSALQKSMKALVNERRKEALGVRETVSRFLSQCGKKNNLFIYLQSA